MFPTNRRVRVVFCLAVLNSVALAAFALAAPRTAPEGLFKNLDDAVVGDAVLINGKQLFIDDYLIESLEGVEKVLNQPVKHAENPLLVRDQPWEESGPGYSTMLYDREERIFKL